MKPEELSAGIIDSTDRQRNGPLKPGKIICVGLNYHDHCREQGIQPPAYPMLFSKFANAVARPGEPVVRPRATEKLDLECELAVVIGRRTKSIGLSEALDPQRLRIRSRVNARIRRDSSTAEMVFDVCEIEGTGVLENPIIDELPRIADHTLAAG